MQFKLDKGTVVADLENEGAECIFYFVNTETAETACKQSIALTESEIKNLISSVVELQETINNRRPRRRLVHYNQKNVCLQKMTDLIRVVSFCVNNEFFVQLQKLQIGNYRPYILKLDPNASHFNFTLNDNLEEITEFVAGLTGHV